MTKQELATKIAWSMMGIQYRWGGDDPMAGFDCSGLCVEILRSVGRLPRQGDWSSSALKTAFPSTPIAKEGALAFWESKDGHVNHVAYCLDGEHCIEAGGGGSATTTEEAAVEQNAFVRIRTIGSRPGLVGFVDPF